MTPQEVSKKNLILISAISLIIFSTSAIKDVYFLHSNVESPLVQPPLHLKNPASDKNLSLNVNVSGFSERNVEGIVSKYEPNKFTDSIYNGNNFNWKLSQFLLELNLDFKLSKTIFLFGGLNYSGDDNSDRVGGNVGSGFAGGDSVNHFRFDVGANFQSTYYSLFYYAAAEFLPWNLYLNFIGYERNTKTNFNPFVSLLFHTTHNEWFANPFMQLSYMHQNHFKVKVGGALALNDVYIESDVNILNLKPKLSFTLGENYFLSAGASIQFLMGMEKASEEFFVTPFAKINFRF
ncbi:hypothetical protein [Ignavibacterium sp.]|uniref:hypothetical protein n=1 Tax=Ignavibacterium sp. TaxID=2651167 RepID=UPI00307CE184